jgi:hypothetical protein
MAISKMAIKLAEAQGWRCAYCTGVMSLEDGPSCATRDHLRPKMKEGSDARDNLVAACSACNNVRGAKIGVMRFYLRRMDLLKQNTWPPCTWPTKPVLALMRSRLDITKTTRRKARAASRLKDPTAFPISQPCVLAYAGLDGG